MKVDTVCPFAIPCQARERDSSIISNNEAPEEIPRGLFLSAFALHRDRTEELYFITLVLILTAYSPVAGYLAYKRDN